MFWMGTSEQSERQFRITRDSRTSNPVHKNLGRTSSEYTFWRHFWSQCTRPWLANHIFVILLSAAVSVKISTTLTWTYMFNSFVLYVTMFPTNRNKVGSSVWGSVLWRVIASTNTDATKLDTCLSLGKLAQWFSTLLHAKRRSGAVKHTRLYLKAFAGKFYFS